MKELLFTSTPSNLLIPRSVVYSFVSAIFSAPQSKKFSLLFDPHFKKDVLTSCNVIDRNFGGRRFTLFSKRIFSNLKSDIQSDFMELFGHSFACDISLYEMEYLKNKDVFAMTQSLAEITGFYSAFGLQIDPGERADNIAVEAEFLGFLFLKKSLALMNKQVENARTCSEAAHAFLQDHFFKWVPFLVSSVREKTTIGFYRQTIDFVDHFLQAELYLYSK